MLAVRYLCLVSVEPSQVARIATSALLTVEPTPKGAILPRAFRNTKLPANLVATGMPVTWLPLAERGQFYPPILDAMHAVMRHPWPAVLIQTPAAAQVIADRLARSEPVTVPATRPSVWAVQPHRDSHMAEYRLTRLPGVVRARTITAGKPKQA
jgi:hypothetical protein